MSSADKKPNAKTPTKDFGTKISRFMNKYKIALIAVAITLVVALIAVIVIVKVSESNTNKLLIEIDKLELTYNSLYAMDSSETETLADDLTDEEIELTGEYKKTYDQLIIDLKDLSKRGKSKYAGIKADYLLGLMYWEVEDYQSAYDSFTAAYNKSPKTYLGSLSLFNSAAAADGMGDESLALELYQRVYDEFGTTAAESPKALFNIAIIHDQAGDTELAKAVFQQLIDVFSFSEYSRLAQNRMDLM